MLQKMDDWRSILKNGRRLSAIVLLEVVVDTSLNIVAKS